MGQAATFVQDVFGTLITWWEENFPLIQATVETVLGAIQTIWDTVWPYLQSVIETVWENIRTLVDTGINAVLGIITAIMLLIQGDWQLAWDEIKLVIDTIWTGIKTVIENTLNTVLELLGTNLEEMLAAISAKIGDFIQAGKNIVQGVVDGIKAAPGKIKDALLGLAQSAWNAVQEFFGISSPSTLAIEMGENITASLAMGIEKKRDDVLDSLEHLSMDMAATLAGTPSWAELIAREFMDTGKHGQGFVPGGPGGVLQDGLEKQMTDMTSTLAGTPSWGELIAREFMDTGTQGQGFVPGFVPGGPSGILQDGGRGGGGATGGRGGGGAGGRGGGDTVVNLHITAILPGMGTFESGEISQRVAENEGQLIDMRISMAAASV
ncbi:unnamed protein product [marine sediment metagenome]|uniref:Bacteriophage tail tape measure C-terminal domain-containing protein n=1 Tax=marine sediment metagenome TaxID=412755 RepID=X1EIE6_9ZZZZ